MVYYTQVESSNSKGVIGILPHSPGYLVVITGKGLAATIKNGTGSSSDIFCVEDIAIIPLEARLAKESIQAAIRRRSQAPEANDDTSGEEEVLHDDPTEKSSDAQHEEHLDEETVMENVIQKRGLYGRFARKWFSTKGWYTENERSPALSPDLKRRSAEQIRPSSPGHDSLFHTLLPKLLRTTRILLTSKSFYFSADYDLTRPFSSQSNPPSGNLRKLDAEYFWNARLLEPFQRLPGCSSYLVPLVQGFVGQEALLAEDDVCVILTLVSRRSVYRAGLRYLRRGIDEAGHCANSVETEQLVSTPSATFSYLQVRASIPLFFSQTPNTFAPVPVLQRTPESNRAAFRLHFDALRRRYGRVIALSLVERKGREGVLGERYANEARDQGIEFAWFDFHAECRGMKFENVDRVFESIGEYITDFGWTEEWHGEKLKQQSGVARTNCMDCLDRTNVLQSAISRRILRRQLERVGIAHLTAEQEQTLDRMFNILWADHGDAVSRQYAGTAAMKGDYTRTRQRNIKGVLTDLGISIERYYSNLLSDHFTQIVIDYLLGNVDQNVFAEFEARMMATDPAFSSQKVRENAIDTAADIAVNKDEEELVGGWNVTLPETASMVRTSVFKEGIVLLTNAAVYACAFDADMEKVSTCQRIALDSVNRIQRGVYITSALSAGALNSARNHGCVVSYSGGGEMRENVRSMQNKTKNTDDAGRIAFKAIVTAGRREKELINEITDEIQRMCGKSLIVEQDIVTVEEAKRGTSYLQQLEYGIRRLLWA